jgi:acyl carrier protein
MEAQERVFDIIRELSGVENVELNASLQDDISLDSLGMVTLLIMIEDEFKIELDEADMNPFDLLSVDNVVTLVKKYTEANHE